MKFWKILADNAHTHFLDFLAGKFNLILTFVQLFIGHRYSLHYVLKNKIYIIFTENTLTRSNKKYKRAMKISSG